MITRLYAALLYLYPYQFRSEFGEEMQMVFEEAAQTRLSKGAKLFLFLRELLDLPGSLFEVYGLRGGNMSVNKDYISPSTRRQAFFGILPFLAFGMVSMIGKIDQLSSYMDISTYVAFYLLALAGMLIGWTRGFPLWSYSYLGWTLVFTWWWSGMTINGMYWGIFILIPLGLTVLSAIILTRSIDPIKKFFSDIWKDWSRLSLAMYTFIAFAYLIYDENHHPYLVFFMTAATLVIAAGAWFFLRSANFWSRAASVWAGFIVSSIISQICSNTWDAAAYYGFPEGPPDPWLMTVFRMFIIFSFFSVFLLWPALVALIQRMIFKKAV